MTERPIPKELYSGIDIVAESLGPRRAELRVPVAVRDDEYPEDAETIANLLADFTDAGNANFLASSRGRNLLYEAERRVWRVWDPPAWRLDRNGRIYRIAEQTIRDMLRIAADLPPEDLRSLTKHARSSLNVRRFKAMVEMAQAKLPVTREEFDGDDSLLAVRNGVIDLRTGAFRPGQREDMITRVAGTQFEPDAKAPLWEAFIERIFEGDRDLIEFVRRSFGYSLSGDTREQVFFLLHGVGQNGKSTLLRTLAHVLGDYGSQTPCETFLQRKGDRPSNDLAALDGARFVTAVEPEENRRIAASVIKQLTGEDNVTARFHFREFFTYRPRYKIWLAANHKPVVRDDSQGMWRRVRLIPFNVQIPEAERDTSLAAKLAEELPGILNWALAGARSWCREGLGHPAAVMNATAAYRVEMDVLGDFLDEQCVIETRQSAVFGDLFAAYERWSRERSERPATKSEFSTQLDQRGFRSRRGAKGARYRDGIALKGADAERVTG